MSTVVGFNIGSWDNTVSSIYSHQKNIKYCNYDNVLTEVKVSRIKENKLEEFCKKLASNLRKILPQIYASYNNTGIIWWSQERKKPDINTYFKINS